MTDFTEELHIAEPIASPNSRTFFKRSTLALPKQSPSYANWPPANDDDNVGSDSDEENLDDNDNDFNSPLQQFLQANEPSIKDFYDNKFSEPLGGTSSSNAKTSQKYSMEPDMLFGWKPKYVPQAPVPLRFFSPMMENIVNFVHKSEASQRFPELIYQGFRPENTLFMHEKYSSPETYNIKFSPFLLAKHELFCKLTANNSINPKRPFIGMKQGVKDDCLVFDSIFEHGNLDTAIRKANNEYDLFVRVDSNTKGHTSWYYFTLKNMKKGQKVRFNILNLSKNKSLYQRGMKPYGISQKKFQEKKVGWHQCGEDISYERASISYLYESFQEPNHKKYYKLSFEYTFEHDDDIVSFALCPPYTYTQLLQFIQSLLESQRNRNDGIYLTTSKLCYSLSGVNTPLLTITDPDESQVPMAKRQYVVCTGRVHPGETNSSWMIQGFISELCKPTKEAKYLRRRFIFKIVPMLNPDGVIVGNHRTGMCGSDLNRQFVSPKEVLHPNLIALKEVVKEIVADKKEVFAYIDFHGHSQKKNVFMYGAEFPVYDPNYYRVKMLPKLLSKRTDMFRFQSCTFTISRPKMTTARAVFSIQYGITHFYTLEASYSNYINTERETIAFDSNKFMEMGVALTEGLSDYRKLLDEEESTTKHLKMKQGELLRLNMGKAESVIPGDKISGRLRLGLTEEKPSLKSVSENNTPKLGSEKEKKKNNKFRIRKGKPLEIEGSVLNNGDNESNRNNIENSFEASKKSIRGNINVDGGTGRDEEGADSKENSVPQGVNLGILNLIEELKVDMINREDNKADSDDFSEGGSDSEGSEDDFSSDEMKKVLKNIVNSVDKFRDMCKNGEKYEMAAQKPKVKKFKKSDSSNIKTLPKEKPSLKSSLLQQKTIEQTPRDKKTLNVAESPSTRQSNRPIQTASERNTSRSLVVQKMGDISARTPQTQSQLKPKASLLPKEVQIDGDSTNNMTQIKNQLSSFYLGSLSASRKEGNLQRFITSAHGNRNQKPGYESPESKKPSTYESVKVIYMSPQMDRHYQIPQQNLKFPIDYSSNNKLSSFVSSYPKGGEPLTEDNDIALSLHLDKGYNKPLGQRLKPEKDMCSIDQGIENNRTKEEIEDMQSSQYRSFVPRQSNQMSHVSHSVDQQGKETQDGEESAERNLNRGRQKFAGGSSHITVATSIFYTGSKGESFPAGVTPLKKNRNLPVAFETYKKMLYLRRKTEDVKERKVSSSKVTEK